MHDTALEFGKLFFQTYIDNSKNINIVDVGSLNVNGTLRTVAPKDANYLGVDMEPGEGVDLVMTDPYLIPLKNNYADVVVSTSCFEHSEFFWITFNEICRILKKNGLIYLNAPSNGVFHQFPKDYYRFYPDSGFALQNWARKSGYEVTLLEAFIGKQKAERWNDFVGIYLKSNSVIELNKIKEKRITKKISNFDNGYSYGEKAILNYSRLSEEQKLIDLKDNLIVRANEYINSKKQEIVNLTQVTQAKEQEINKILNSISWKMTTPLRYAMKFFRHFLSIIKILLKKYILNKIIILIKLLKNQIILFFSKNINKKKFFNWALDNKYFDPIYYRDTYNIEIPDNKELFEFFLTKGYLSLHSPSRSFSTIIYKSLKTDLPENFNPLYHFYLYGRFEDSLLIYKIQNLRIDSYGYETPFYEKPIKNFKKKIDNNPKVFAFFLPGFHQDTYNDKFWGNSFTEWENLKKNNHPLFLGHKYPYQPYIYYDLSDDKVIEDQCILAKNNGIDGFYIFLYDFSNNIHPLYKIIPKLIEILTRHGLEFCFEWANEPWTRRWDGLEHDVLLEQDKVVNKIQIELFVKRIVNFVKQKNYLTVDGKKFFTIYRPGYFKNLDQVIIDIKKEFQKYDLDIHLSGCNTFSTSQKILSKMDSIVEYPPHPLDLNVNYHFKSINENRTNIWCYKKFILFYINYLNFFKSNKRIFRTAFASWDNTPRKGKDSNLYVNYSRANFIKLLSSIFSSELKNNYKEKIIFINSWNEWGEGAHIEPDKQFGFWKLNVINEIKSNYQNSLIHNSNSVEKFYTDNINLALIHVYDPKHYKFIIDFANKFKKIDFYVTIPMFVFNFKLEKNFKNLIIKFVHNEERDFNILYHSKKILGKSKYKIISKIHFKGRDQTNNFYMAENISYKIAEEQLLLNNTLLGEYNTKNNHIYFKKNWMLKNQKDYLGSNEKNLKDFANKNNFNFEEFLNTKFLSGGIWTLIDNSDSLLEFVNLIDKVKFTLDNFHIPNDGKYLHTLERFTLPFFLNKSFKLKYI